MKAKMIIAGLFGLALFSLPSLHADTVADTPAAVVNPASGKVGAAVSTLPIFNGATPNTSARYYIYLCSASWCGPCNREMPQVVEAYKQMKESGIAELILIDCDRNEADARAFVQRYGATFPAVMADKVQALPGYTSPRGIPAATIVDADGNVVKTGHGSLVKAWKQLISAYETEKGLKQSFPQMLTLTASPVRIPLASVDDDEEEDADKKKKKKKKSTRGIVGDVCRRIKWQHGKPNLKAKYYIYVRMENPVYVSSYSGYYLSNYDKDTAAVISQFHKEMVKDKRVEVLILSNVESAQAIRYFAKECKLKCAIANFRKDTTVTKLPGFVQLSEYDHSAIFVRASDGKIIKRDSAHDLIGNWRNIMMEAEDSEPASSSDDE